MKTAYAADRIKTLGPEKAKIVYTQAVECLARAAERSPRKTKASSTLQDYVDTYEQINLITHR